jgi:hypothetical protein
MNRYNTKEEAMQEEMFALDAPWLPFMLCETHDGKYAWVGLGNYSGRSRGSMTNKEKEEALSRAHLIGAIQSDDGRGDFKRGICIRDYRGTPKVNELMDKQFRRLDKPAPQGNM